MISNSNEQLQQELEYTLLEPDCHRWSISKMQSDTLEERYKRFKEGRESVTDDKCGRSKKVRVDGPKG